VRPAVADGPAREREVLLTPLPPAGVARPQGWGWFPVMSMCVRYAGESYTYLLDSVTTDHGRAGATPMTRYYAAHGTPPGTWLGAGLTGLADGAGLTPGSFVTPVQMERLFANGEDPATGTPLGQSPHVYTGPADRRRPVAGFDCTFTAPKSVSVLWALADDTTREVVYECHRQAITETIAARARASPDSQPPQDETRGGSAPGRSVPLGSDAPLLADL